MIAMLMAVSLRFAASAQSTSSQDSSGAAPAATAVDTTTQMTENPPLSGLDQPSFEPGFGVRSYLALKAEVSEGVDSNASGNLSSRTNISETTRALGSVELQKLWKMHPLNIDYIGGVGWYNRVNSTVRQVHTLAATQRFLWRSGQLVVRDSFSYLPEGSFGSGSFGGAGGIPGGGVGGGVSGGGISGGGGDGIFSNGQFGSIGTQPRVTNMSIVDVTQYLSPRSSIVLAGGYGWTDFLNNPQGYLNSQQTIAQAGFNRQFSRRDQIAVTYAFEELHFPTSAAGSANVNIWQLLYRHHISGKLDFVVGGGPEWIHTHQTIDFLGIISIPEQNSFITGSARASLVYHLSARTNMRLTYMRYVSAGSGFFAGARTDAIRLGLSHNLARHWTIMADTGYSRNSRLLAATAAIASNARDYHYWYAGGGLHRQLGRQFAVFASYQYSIFGFGSRGCSAALPNCGGSYGRNVGLLGLHWTPHPIRLD